MLHLLQQLKHLSTCIRCWYFRFLLILFSFYWLAARERSPNWCQRPTYPPMDRTSPRESSPLIARDVEDTGVPPRRYSATSAGGGGDGTRSISNKQYVRASVVSIEDGALSRMTATEKITLSWKNLNVSVVPETSKRQRCFCCRRGGGQQTSAARQILKNGYVSTTERNFSVMNADRSFDVFQFFKKYLDLCFY